ncbi:MAG: 2-oxo acid dehydrogenase subunit E2 [Chloroflexi bacterium]|nr:2-oxo acid dehydrogenase subunit E2 [Chloroflexota bacterium]
MAETIAMPKLGFDMAEGTLVRWLKREGETVQKGEVLAEIETDKATVEVEASVAGTIRRLIVAERSTVPVGAPIAILGTPDEPIDVLPAGQAAAGEPAPRAASPAPAPATTPAVGTSPPAGGDPTASGNLTGGVRASPLAHRLASERGLDLKAIAGSGPAGRIVKKDVLGASLAPAVPSGPGETLPLTRLRSAIGRRMLASKQQIPHFYLSIDVDAERLADTREQLNSSQPEGSKLSINDFIVKASALALRDVPGLNASLAGDSILRHAQVNVGVAVAVEDGLLTVVVRDADTRPLLAIGQEIREMVGRARQGRVRPEDVEGSTFTVSNLGMFEIDHFIAIINPPEAAILAVGSLRATPVVRDGQLAPGLRLKVTLSADHRVTDGAEAARWLQALRSRLEHPLSLLL